MHHLPQRIIISGGPCSGKTSLINALNNEGYFCFDEIARKVIKQESELKSNRLPWLDNLAFSEKVLELMEIDNLTARQHQLCFFDRGIPDLVAYMKFYKNEVSPKFIEQISLAPYSQNVLFLEPWQEIYTTDDQRIETFEEAQQISHFIELTYLEHGFKIIKVPKLSVNQRVNFICSFLNSH